MEGCDQVSAGIVVDGIAHGTGCCAGAVLKVAVEAVPLKGAQFVGAGVGPVRGDQCSSWLECDHSVGLRQDVHVGSPRNVVSCYQERLLWMCHHLCCVVLSH